MKNLLIVGENPFSTTGNAKMMRYILTTIDTRQYCVHIFSIDTAEPDPIAVISRPIPFPFISSLCHRRGNYMSPYGSHRIIEILSRKQFDLVLFVGVDIWLYADIYKTLNELKQKNKFLWGGLFPYDQQIVREDWVKWFNMADFPCVYSQFGYKLLKDHVENIRYFRPGIPYPNFFLPAKEDAVADMRAMYFEKVPKNAIIFGFFGANQFRKDPQKLIQALALLRKDIDVVNKGVDVRLYMHTQDISSGVFNLTQTAIDCGLGSNGELLIKNDLDWFTDAQIAELVHSVDCVINCSMQEGLSWTVIEAMSAGRPVIASRSTSHIELLEGTKNLLVRCESDSSLPVITNTGRSFVPTKACDVSDIYFAMKKVALNDVYRASMGESGRQKYLQWEKGCTKITDLLNMVVADVEKPIVVKRTTVEKKILFAQHSSAGDVLMTTKALKGLKDRHPGLPLVYMTQKKYQDILVNNPNVDEIIDWDENHLHNKYQFTYNPHGDRILPGHWGRNSNSLLSDFYWKILGVPNGGFFIELVQPNMFMLDEEYGYIKSIGGWHPPKDEPKEIVIVHTTGGDPEFRTYKYMGDVCSTLREINKYITVQVGGENDYPAGADIDLSGKLSFRETAWVMSKASLAVTVDSFISHLAGALGISQVCLFGSGNYFVVKPDQVGGELICLNQDYLKYCTGLGPCSGAVKDCPVKCTGRHSPEDILKAIDLIENRRAVK